MEEGRKGESEELQRRERRELGRETGGRKEGKVEC